MRISAPAPVDTRGELAGRDHTVTIRVRRLEHGRQAEFVGSDLAVAVLVGPLQPLDKSAIVLRIKGTTGEQRYDGDGGRRHGFAVGWEELDWATA
jgi:hypothetical protein